MADQVSNFDWGSMHWLASEALGNSSALSVARMVLHPGQSNDAHRHPNCEEALYLLRGAVEHRVGDVRLTQAMGTVVVIPQGMQHATTNVGAEPAELLVSYSSGARDYRPEN